MLGLHELSPKKTGVRRANSFASKLGRSAEESTGIMACNCAIAQNTKGTWYEIIPVEVTWWWDGSAFFHVFVGQLAFPNILGIHDVVMTFRSGRYHILPEYYKEVNKVAMYPFSCQGTFGDSPDAGESIRCFWNASAPVIQKCDISVHTPLHSFGWWTMSYCQLVTYHVTSLLICASNKGLTCIRLWIPVNIISANTRIIYSTWGLTRLREIWNYVLST